MDPSPPSIEGFSPPVLGDILSQAKIVGEWSADADCEERRPKGGGCNLRKLGEVAGQPISQVDFGPPSQRCALPL